MCMNKKVLGPEFTWSVRLIRLGTRSGQFGPGAGAETLFHLTSVPETARDGRRHSS